MERENIMKIHDNCIDCGACREECPSGAIYPPGMPWKREEELKPAISDKIYYLVPELCSNCSGQKALLCLQICPMRAIA